MRRSETIKAEQPAPDDVNGHDMTENHWVRTLRLPWETGSSPEARRALAQSLRVGGLPESVVDEAETVASELVTNAILHGRPLYDDTVRLHWRVRGDRVEIEVTDGGGSTQPAARRPSPWAQNGRGLRIVRSVAHEWGVTEEEDRVTVWAALGGPSRRRV